jgi:hypothetical protein
MAVFLLENRDFLGFRMIFKVRLNQIFANFNTPMQLKLENVDLVITDTLAFQILNEAMKGMKHVVIH